MHCSVLLLSPDNLILLMRVSVVKHAKQILPCHFEDNKSIYTFSCSNSILAWSVDSLAKKVVGEKQTVALVVQLVVTILNIMTKIEIVRHHECHLVY